MDNIRLSNYNNYKNNTNDNKATYKEILMIKRKTKNLYKDETLEKFGFGKKNPEYRVDVLGSTNVTGDYYLNTYLLIPPGSIFPFAGNNQPEGYLFCNGNPISRSSYNRLFQTIGTLYGSGDGNTTFNLPDFRGRTPIGTGNGSGLSNRILSDVGGEETHSLTVDEMPSHNHTASSSTEGDHTHTINDPGHSHTVINQVQKTGANTPAALDSSPNEIDNVSLASSGTGNATTGITINTTGAHSHTITVNNTGNNQSHNNMQPFIVINYIIRY